VRGLTRGAAGQAASWKAQLLDRSEQVGYIAGKLEAWAASKLLANVNKGEKYIEGAALPCVPLRGAARRGGALPGRILALPCTLRITSLTGAAARDTQGSAGGGGSATFLSAKAAATATAGLRTRAVARTRRGASQTARLPRREGRLQPGGARARRAQEAGREGSSGTGASRR
jgi:hypothetical protein